MRLALFILIVLLFNACTTAFRGASIPAVPRVTMTDVSNEKRSNEKPTRVELDIFSGRPNPTWSLSSADTATLAGMIEKLSRAEPAVLFDGLGYRGFIVTSPTPLVGATTIVVQRDIVKLSADNFRKDFDRTIERWLLMKAKSELPVDVYEFAEKEIEGRPK
jgi:hypothetical protein